MKFNNIKQLVVLIVISLSMQSCFKDLDRYPQGQSDSEALYSDFANYKSLLAKLYAGLSVSGQEGPAGNPDIKGIDEGFSSYLRQYWLIQELPTDEAKIAWSDGTIQDYNRNGWTSGSEFVAAMYYRIFYEIAICNEFIKETQEAKLNERGISGENKDLATQYRNEARFLRALAYSHAIDLFGTVPFVDENSNVAEELPKQISRAELFNFVETELVDLSNSLGASGTVEYGRADQAAAWMLLAKLYLNAEVYTGSARWAEAMTYTDKVINQSGRLLNPTFAYNFNADNNTSSEIIFPITFDGVHTRTYGGMTFLIHAAVSNDVMDPVDFGIGGGWGGIRTTENILNLYDAMDDRNMLQTTGFTTYITDLKKFIQGVGVRKFTNVTSAGNSGQSGEYADTDFPLFRLAEALLMYAEINLRGGGGNAAQALDYINKLRTRAHAATISAGDLDLDFVLEERARELLWECQRRTDLIRFGKYTDGNYLWPFKGGSENGSSFADYRKLFPIPAAEMNANTKLIQNPGY